MKVGLVAGIINYMSQIKNAALRYGVIPTPPRLSPSQPFKVILLPAADPWLVKAPVALLEQHRITLQAEMRIWDNFFKLWMYNITILMLIFLEVMEP